MRIDLNPSAMTELARSNDAAAGTKPADMTKLTAPNTEDIAHLSSGSESVQKLRMQLDALPEVRQERVEALRQSISVGTYKISPESIATAMLADAGRKVG